MTEPLPFPLAGLLGGLLAGGVASFASAQHVIHTSAAPILPDASFPQILAVGDIDGDARGDYVVRALTSGTMMTVVSGRTGAPVMQTPFWAVPTGIERPMLLVDLEGDGILEFVSTTSAYSAGDVFVRRGGPDGPLLFTLPLPALTHTFGNDVRVGGDLDLDGVRDLIVVAVTDPATFGGQLVWGVGRVYIHSGADGALLAEFTPPVMTHAFGSSVVILPDVNDDSAPDVAIASITDGWLFSGATRTALWPLGAPAINGTSLADLGDVDGDGWHDVAFGAVGGGWPVTSGQVRVFSGHTGQQLWSLAGSGLDRFAHAVANCGDVDGDGIADLAVGEPQRPIWGGMGIGPGRVTIVSGANGNPLATIAGPVLDEGFGAVVASLGDVDGDGHVDLLAGSDHAPSAVVHVISVRPRPLSADAHLAWLDKGAAQHLTIDVGPAHADRGYLVVGSVSGTAPGFAVGGVHVPLNPDFWSATTIGHPNSPLLQGTLGSLDANGRGVAAIRLPPLPLPSLHGLSLAHAAVVFDKNGLRTATNPVLLTLQQ